MSQDVPDKERLAAEINFGNQPVFVSRQIKDHVRLHPVGASENLLHIRKVLPFANCGDAIPIIQRRPCIRVCCLEPTNRLVADDVHAAPKVDVPITGTI